MNAEIINIGDELLIGQVINSNAAYLSQSLNSIGIDIPRVTVISDKREAIISALDNALEDADLVLMTGGLGPTNDDITKQVLCEYFNTQLVFCQEAYDDIEKMFSLRNYPMTEVNRQQAFLPEHAISFPNSRGTARGMWLEKGGKVVVAMPGVPFEMTALMELSIMPALTKRFFSDNAIIHRTMVMTGIGESALAEKIQEWEDNLPPCTSLAYLPVPGYVRLRLTGKSDNKALLEQILEDEFGKLRQIASPYIFAEKDTTPEAFIVEELINRGLTLSTAESCTGGLIAHLLTTISGSSGCFNGSVVAYSNEVKISLLDVSQEPLEKHGAVSEEVVRQMAENVRLKLNTDFGIATSGIAGPTGATEGKPVGTIWIAVSNGERTLTECFHFGSDRKRNIQRGAMAALDILWKGFLR